MGHHRFSDGRLLILFVYLTIGLKVDFAVLELGYVFEDHSQQYLRLFEFVLSFDLFKLMV